MNATATITIRPIHTLTSHILHNMHNQGILLNSLYCYYNYQHVKHYYEVRYQYQFQQFQETVLTH